MNNVAPTIMQSLAPFMGSMGMFSNNPEADAADHFDRLADTFTTDVTYIGLDLCVEVNKHSLRAVDIVGPDGSDLYYEFSEQARNNIAHLALEQMQ